MIRLSLILTFIIATLPANAFFFNKKQKDQEYQQKTEIVDGISRYYIKEPTKRGPVVINILAIDLNNKNVSLKVGLSDYNHIQNKNTLSSIVKNAMSFAGLNANYFDNAGNPIGALIYDSEWLVSPILNRVAIGFSKNKDVFFDQVKLDGQINVSRGFFKKESIPLMLQIDCLNTPLDLCDGVNFINPKLTPSLKLPRDQFAYVIKNDCIKHKDSRNVDVPDNGYVLVGDKKSELKSLHKWDCLTVSWNTSPEWSDIEYAISGGPYLIKDGQIYIDEEDESIRFANNDFFAPRSAIGVDMNNVLYLVAVDGRQEGYSVGFSLLELSEFLKGLGVHNAINLDGGGSTTLVLNDRILNKPSDGEERRISNGILIFYKDETKDES